MKLRDGFTYKKYTALSFTYKKYTALSFTYKKYTALSFIYKKYPALSFIYKKYPALSRREVPGSFAGALDVGNKKGEDRNKNLEIQIRKPISTLPLHWSPA